MTLISRWVRFGAALALVGTALVAFHPNAAGATVIGTTDPSARHISLIGDSTLAGARWNNTWGTIGAYNFVYDAESCRRTITPSCRGREGITPDNVIDTMKRLSGQLGSVLVIMGGYDDPGATFAPAVDAVIAEARDQGVFRVMWLTMRTAEVTYVGPNFQSNSSTYLDNNKILLSKAVQYPDKLVLADWATYSATHPEWVYADGIHLRPEGSTAVMDFVKTSLDTLFLQTSQWIPYLGVGGRQTVASNGCPVSVSQRRRWC